MKESEAFDDEFDNDPYYFFTIIFHISLIP